MNTYAEERRQHLAAILGDERVNPMERLSRAAAFLEGEVKSAFTRGVRRAKQPEKEDA